MIKNILQPIYHCIDYEKQNSFTIYTMLKYHYIHFNKR